MDSTMSLDKELPPEQKPRRTTDPEAEPLLNFADQDSEPIGLASNVPSSVVLLPDGSLVTQPINSSVALPDRRSDTTVTEPSNESNGEANAFDSGDSQAEPRPFKYSAAPGPAPSGADQSLVHGPEPGDHYPPQFSLGGASAGDYHSIPGPAPDHKRLPLSGPAPHHSQQGTPNLVPLLSPTYQPGPQYQVLPSQFYAQNQFPHTAYQPYQPPPPVLTASGPWPISGQFPQQPTQERKPIKTSKIFDSNTISDNQYYISICLCIVLTVFCNPIPFICCIPAFYFASKSAEEKEKDNYDKALEYHKRAQFLNIGGFVIFILVGVLILPIIFVSAVFASSASSY